MLSTINKQEKNENIELPEDRAWSTGTLYIIYVELLCAA